MMHATAGKSTNTGTQRAIANFPKRIHCTPTLIRDSASVTAQSTEQRPPSTPNPIIQPSVSAYFCAASWRDSTAHDPAAPSTHRHFVSTVRQLACSTRPCCYLPCSRLAGAGSATPRLATISRMTASDTHPAAAAPAQLHSSSPSTTRALQWVQETFAIEAAALQQAAARFRQPAAAAQMEQAVATMLHATGRVVVMGMGKSGHVGRKIAATLASTGTPAFFVHPAEAGHGDLGMVTSADVVLAISNSGESEELARVLPVLKRQGVPLIAMTGKPQSSLARHAHIVLDSSVEKEACPLNLAPTASTTVQMALGDALAVALLDARGFRAEDFARSHPGGALGRRLLTTVADVMRADNAAPAVPEQASFSDVMREMSAKGLGATMVVNAKGQLLGIFTDGDLRRLIEAGTDLRTQTAASLMHAQPRSIRAEALAADAARLMEEHRINSLPVVDAQGMLVGALNTHDLMHAKVI